jgi:outer membrane protein assembly factor BamB
VRSYDLASGKVLGECGGLGVNCIPSAAAGFGMIYAMSGHREPALLAIRYQGASGDLTDSAAVAWRLEKDLPYVPSPLLYDDKLYLLKKNTDVLACYNAKTGQAHYTNQRLEDIDGVYASIVGADGRVYVVGMNGVTYVLKHGPEFGVLAVNRLDDRFGASPAIVDSDLYLRGHKRLYCIATD